MNNFHRACIFRLVILFLFFYLFLFSAFSLVKALTAGSLQSTEATGEKITDGIDITTWNKTDLTTNDAVTFSVWDFAGQTVYYNTHQVRPSINT